MREVIASVIPYVVLLFFILSIIALLHVLLRKVSESYKVKTEGIHDMKRRYGGYVALTTATGATLGSLFYSEIMGYTPCPLCWWQRIFMYPLVLILLIALFSKDKKASRYVASMSAIGFFIAIWHYVEQMTEVAICTGELADCGIRYTFYFDFMTIPVMAATAFFIIFIYTLFWSPIKVTLKK